MDVSRCGHDRPTIMKDSFGTAFLLSMPHTLFVSRLDSLSLKMTRTEKRLEEMGIKLPPAPIPAANYVPCQQTGDLLFLSGHLPLNEDGTILTGLIGGSNGKDLKYGYQAARQVGLNLVSTMKEYLGDLDRVDQVVKLFGIVQSDESFHEQHKVVNGCSDLMIEVFGPDRGLHARSAIGTSALPLDISVEIEAIVRVKPALN